MALYADAHGFGVALHGRLQKEDRGLDRPRDGAHLLDALGRFHENHVRARLGEGLPAADRLVEAKARARVGARGREYTL